jgi:hypothetical protein
MKLLARLLMVLILACGAFLILADPAQNVGAETCSSTMQQCERCQCQRLNCREKCPASGDPTACAGLCESTYEACVGDNKDCPWFDGTRPKPRPAEILE